MEEKPCCHICGKLAPLFVMHEISIVDMPSIIIHVFYCKECAQLLDKFEHFLYEIKKVR